MPGARTSDAIPTAALGRIQRTMRFAQQQGQIVGADPM
jgi:hypothetical protein